MTVGIREEQMFFSKIFGFQLFYEFTDRGIAGSRMAGDLSIRVYIDRGRSPTSANLVSQLTFFLQKNGMFICKFFKICRYAPRTNQNYRKLFSQRRSPFLYFGI